MDPQRATLRLASPGLVLLLGFSLGLGCSLGSGTQPESRDQPRVEPEIRLFDDLGSFGRKVRTDSEQAQRYFDQGLNLRYGFNDDAAVRSFRTAQLLDPGCAMCFFGEALALGPNINAPMGPDAHLAAHRAVGRARVLAKDPVERDLIGALAVRYDPAREADRGVLDAAYAEAMAGVASRHAADDDIQTIYAASLMNLSPWRYYDEAGRPAQHTPTIVSTLETVMERNPAHPGANHYYIHAVEPSNSPERAVPAAERLETLVPGSGHLVHMPTHIYWRVGRYADAVRLNQRAVGVDESTIGWCGSAGFYPAGYYTHNIHFVWAAASEQGSSTVALGAARKLEVETRKRLADFPFLAEYLLPPVFTLVRFGRWDAVLAEPEPDDALPYVQAWWRYARGLAFLRKGDAEAAAREAATLRSLAADERFAELWVSNGLNRGSDLLRIASLHLDGERAAAAGDPRAAIDALEAAVQVQDGLAYIEPPPFYFPVRQALGAVLLDAGQPTRAESVYRRDLEQHPATPWSLFGLAQSLRAQRRADEATLVERGFSEAWSKADVRLERSRF